ncbi:hypothetical protein [Ideonella sp.]|uniref:hypothetical protein n=1 Tax=Ideonella sp. TaxID=1929293 RepID=UPI0035B3792A
MSAKRPRLILHIGTHKTGTSAIQRALESARQSLLQEGLLYPATRRPPWPDLPKHCSVFQAATSADPAQQLLELDMLRREFDASAASDMLISDEGLSEPDDRIVRFFAPLTQRFDVQVLCFLRRQDLFVESLFNQFVREPARREPRPLLTFSRAPGTRARLDYHAMLVRWAALPARVTAIDFDGAMRGSTLKAVISHAIGYPSLNLPIERDNPSPDMRLALLMNRMNRQRIPYDPLTLIQAAHSLTQSGLAPLRHILGSDERRRLLAECEAGNQRLAADFGVQFSKDLPAHEPFCATEDLDGGFTLQLLGGLSQPRTTTPVLQPAPPRTRDSVTEG